MPVKQLQAAGDDHERVAEVVRHATPELAHRLHLLRLAALLLGEPQRRRGLLSATAGEEIGGILIRLRAGAVTALESRFLRSVDLRASAVAPTSVVERPLRRTPSVPVASSRMARPRRDALKEGATR